MHRKPINKSSKKKRTIPVFLGLLMLVATSFTRHQEDVKYEPIVAIETNMGVIKVKLFAGTPQHRDNFLKNIKDKLYVNTVLHRIVRDFLVQGGDPASKTAGRDVILGTTSLEHTVPSEVDSKYFHKKGALGMMRNVADPKSPASSACMFYIVHGRKYDAAMLNRLEQRHPIEGFKFTEMQRKMYSKVGGAPHLDGKYTVFGEVIEGFEIVEKIAVVPVDGVFRPVDDIMILSVTVQK